MTDFILPLTYFRFFISIFQFLWFSSSLSGPQLGVVIDESIACLARWFNCGSMCGKRGKLKCLNLRKPIFLSENTTGVIRKQKWADWDREEDEFGTSESFSPELRVEGEVSFYTINVDYSFSLIITTYANEEEFPQRKGIRKVIISCGTLTSLGVSWTLTNRSESEFNNIWKWDIYEKYNKKLQKIKLKTKYIPA